MNSSDLIIGFLLLLSGGLCICILILDARTEQLKGYIKRIERELKEARAARWRK